MRPSKSSDQPSARRQVRGEGGGSSRASLAHPSLLTSTSNTNPSIESARIQALARRRLPSFSFHFVRICTSYPQICTHYIHTYYHIPHSTSKKKKCTSPRSSINGYYSYRTNAFDTPRYRTTTRLMLYLPPPTRWPSSRAGSIVHPLAGPIIMPVPTRDPANRPA